MKKLTTKVQVLYALGVSYAIVDQIFAQWILYFYLPSANSGLKPFMAAVLVSIALAVSRFVDMITDPLVGFLSDKYNGRTLSYSVINLAFLFVLKNAVVHANDTTQPIAIAICSITLISLSPKNLTNPSGAAIM